MWIYPPYGDFKGRHIQTHKASGVSLKTHERRWGRSEGELDALKGHGVCAVTYPALLLDETLQLLLLGAQLLFQLPTAGLKPLCVLPSQQIRQWVLHPAHLAFSLGRMHVNTLISWDSWATFAL